MGKPPSIIRKWLPRLGIADRVQELAPGWGAPEQRQECKIGYPIQHSMRWRLMTVELMRPIGRLRKTLVEEPPFFH